MKVYLDNAATTALDPAVLEAMTPYLTENYGNPSSIHSFGRIARSAVEKARKKIADLLNSAPSEIFFTSGGTEADNIALRGCVRSYEIRRVISSRLEHHAVLHTLDDLESEKNVKVEYLNLNEQGEVDLQHLKNLLQDESPTLVTLMHGNNEIGNLTDIQQAAEICRHYGAIFHSDTVQTIAHIPVNISELELFSINGSAHKFHGPKGTGFIYINNAYRISPLLSGGAQERNMRGGTENVAGIVGMAKALELAYAQMEENNRHIASLKKRLKENLINRIPGVEINGTGPNENKSLDHILNVSLPNTEDNDMLLFNLDINHIAVSAGSACASGSNIDSHVLEAIGANPGKGAIRFSFGKFNTADEVDYVVNKLAEICN